MRTFFQTVLLVFLSIHTVYSQGDSSPIDLPEIISPSPTVSSLMKMEETNVDLYSGQPSIGIPLFSEKIDNSTGLNIGINYSTNNLKLTERSSWVGVSWALSGEAVISRTVRGIPDEFYSTHPSVTDVNKIGVWHNGFYDIDWDNFLVYDPQNPDARTTSANERWLWNASGFGSGKYFQAGQGSYDKDPDLFQVNIFGTTARFIITKNANDLLDVRYLENDANLKISIDYDSNYQINSFTIQNTSGSSFILDEIESTTSQTFSYSRTQNNTDNFSQNLSSNIPTAWKLSEAFDLNENLLLTINYDTVNEVYNAGFSSTENYLTKIIDNGLTWTPGNNQAVYNNIFIFNEAPGAMGYNNGIALPYKQVSDTEYNVMTKKINNIILRNGNIIDYQTQNGHIEYNSGGVLLDKIELKNSSNQTLKTIEFNYLNENRVFLSSIKQYNNDLTTSQDYEFTYLNPELLPSGINSNYFETPIDIWGYFKEDTSTALTPIVWKLHQAESNTSSVLTGSIQQIKYPTGGYKLFEFESNQIGSLGYRNLTQTEFLQMNQKNTDNVQVNMVFDSCVTGGNQPQPSLPIPFTIDFDQTIQLNSNLVCDNISSNTYLNNLKFVINDTSGNLVRGGDFLTNVLIDINAGNYTLTFDNSLNLGSSDEAKIELELFYKSSSNTYQEYIAGGGIRIKTIDDYKDQNQKVRSVSYLYNDSSSYFGVVDGYLSNYKKYNYDHRIEYYSVIGHNSNYVEMAFKPIDLTYRVKEFSLYPHLSLSKGNQVGYQKVFSRINDSDIQFMNSSSDPSSGDLGWSQYEYTSAKDFPTQNGSYFWPFFPKNDQSYKHGLLTKQIDFSNNGDKLKEQINTYEYVTEKVITVPFIYPMVDCGRAVYYSTYDDYLARIADGTKNSLYNTQYDHYGICGSVGSWTPSYIHFGFGEYHNRSLLKSSLTKQYFNGTNGAYQVSSSSSYSYNPDNFQVSEVKTVNSQGQELISRTFYVMDSEVQNEPNIQLLLDNNKVNTPILIESYINGTLTGKVLTKFTDFSHQSANGLIFSAIVHEVHTSKGDDPLEPRLVYHRYDEFGNILEVSKKDGTRVSYIYGHSKTLPIAKIEGLSYEQLASKLAGVTTAQDIIDTIDEDDLPTINNLRDTFTVEDPFMITTYEYAVGIGIKKVTDPRGRNMYYEYDDFNRLKAVRDHEGNILSENEYKYATQN